MKCKSCGAGNTLGANFCAFCGGQLPLTETNEKPAIFARIKSSAQWENRESPARVAALPKHSALQKMFLGGFFIVFIGMSAMGFIMLCLFSGVFAWLGGASSNGLGAGLGFIPMLFSVVPLGFVALGIYLFIKTQKKMSMLETAPVETLAVIVTGKRNHVSGGGQNSSASTTYFVTCEREDGSRQEYQVWDGNLFGRMSDEDAGVLFTKQEYGLDFDRVVT
ncbi:MAG: hypothetical protein COA78_01085 [Blastopirellula sp.]|nr:MAG: hypothetical protein COA78_01085 [Blastopirellula sp.]